MLKKKLVFITFAIIYVLLLVILIILLRDASKVSPEGQYQVNVISNPSGATVYIGKEGPLVTPADVYLYPGQYSLWAFKDNYYNIEKEIFVKEGDNEVILDLDEIPEEFIGDDDFKPQEVDPYPY